MDKETEARWVKGLFKGTELVSDKARVWIQICATPGFLILNSVVPLSKWEVEPWLGIKWRWIKVQAWWEQGRKDWMSSMLATWSCRQGSMCVYICNLRVGHLSQVGNSWPDFRFYMGLGEGGAATTTGSKCQTSQQGHRKEGMMEGNRHPATAEICLWCFYQLSVAIIMLHN